MFVHKSGETYDGEHKDPLPNGHGTYTWYWEHPGLQKSYLLQYVGEWKNGLKHGHGSLCQPYTDTKHGQYVGEWKDGKEHGQGTLTYADGETYVGEFKDGEPWEGTEYDPDGYVTGVYSEGAWKEN